MNIRGTHTRKFDTRLLKLIDIVTNEGFEGIEIPSIEYYDMYSKIGSLSNQMYKFKDKKSRELCLRPECTATISELKKGMYWYFEKCWRYERPQKGRYREFRQFGVEIISPDIDYDKYLRALAERIVKVFTNDYTVKDGVKRGLGYYIKDGFEIELNIDSPQKQIVGGGEYKNGIGFALGYDRIIELTRKEK